MVHTLAHCIDTLSCCTFGVALSLVISRDACVIVKGEKSRRTSNDSIEVLTLVVHIFEAYLLHVSNDRSSAKVWVIDAKLFLALALCTDSTHQ